MDSHGCGDAGPALPARRPARASPAPMAERSEAERPARLARLTLAQARSMEGPADARHDFVIQRSTSGYNQETRCASLWLSGG